MQRKQIIVDFYNTVYHHIFKTGVDPEKWNEVLAGIDNIVVEYQHKLESLFQLAEAELANQITDDINLLPMMFTQPIIEKIYQINACATSDVKNALTLNQGQYRNYCNNTIAALEDLYNIPAFALEENWKRVTEELLLNNLIQQSRYKETRHYPNISRIIQLCTQLVGTFKKNQEPCYFKTMLRVMKLLNNLYPKVSREHKDTLLQLMKTLQSENIPYSLFSKEPQEERDQLASEYRRELFITRQFCQQGEGPRQVKDARFYQLSCQLINQLSAYIERVQSHTLADGSVDYAFGFLCIGRHKRAQNRMANTRLAIDLVRQIQELQDKYDPANAKQALRDLRAIFDKRHLLTVRSSIMPEATRGINSKELNTILRSMR